MKILQINTYDIRGGAARAAYRLHKGLRSSGEECLMLVRHKKSADDTVVQINPRTIDKGFCEALLFGAVQWNYIDAHRTDISNSTFSLPYPGCDLSSLPCIKEADIINLHWVAYYQSPVTVRRLLALGKPVVWTLHDQRPFTGGCHYSSSCEKYKQDCSLCPQLSDDTFSLAGLLLRDNLDLFKGANLTIVAPSYWLAACAKSSRLFADLRVEVIPHSLETQLFTPTPKEAAKEKFGIKSDTVTLLFAAVSGVEKRKGFTELKEAIGYCLGREDFRELAQAGKIKILCFGIPSQELEGTGIPTVSFGYLDSDEQISLAYSAADMFILPSLEDNLPNTMLESMSCGTPVIAFNVGGIPDVLSNDVTGKLVQTGNISQMGEAILELGFNVPLREELGRNGRRLMEEEFTLGKQARRYVALYDDLLTSTASNIQTSSNRSTNERNKTDKFSLPSMTSLNVRSVAEMGPHFRSKYLPILCRSLREGLGRKMTARLSLAQR